MRAAPEIIIRLDLIKLSCLQVQNLKYRHNPFGWFGKRCPNCIRIRRKCCNPAELIRGNLQPCRRVCTFQPVPDGNPAISNEPGRPMQIDERKYFLLWEKASRDTIDVKRVYIDLADDLAAGVLLSQIIFWFLPNQSGRPKTRIQRGGEAWLAKNRGDWHEECRLSPRQYDRAAKILKDKGLIVTRNWHFAGSPCIHVRPVWEKLIAEIANHYEEESADLGSSYLNHGSVNKDSQPVKIDVVDNFVDNVLATSVTDLPNSRIRDMYFTNTLIAYTETTNRDTPLGTADSAAEENGKDLKRETLDGLRDSLASTLNPAAAIRKALTALYGVQVGYEVCGNAWRVATKLKQSPRAAAEAVCRAIGDLPGDAPGTELYDGLNAQLPPGRQEGRRRKGNRDIPDGRIFQSFEAARSYYDYNRPDSQVTMSDMFDAVFPDGRPWNKEEAPPGQKPCWHLAPEYDAG